MNIFRNILLFAALAVLILMMAASILLFLITLYDDLYSRGFIDECFLCPGKRNGTCKTCRYRFRRKEGQVNEKGTRKDD